MRFRLVPLLAMSLLLLVTTCTEMLAATVPPDIKKVVTFVFLADEQGNLKHDSTGSPIPYGTGFFVGVNAKQPNKGIYGYFVTAKHVLADATGNLFSRVFVRLDKKGGDVEYIPLDLLNKGQKTVYTHSDASVDIAMVPWMPDQAKFDFKIIPEDMLTTEEKFSELHIAEGSEVFFAGLMVQFAGEHRNYPVFRFGRVAMLPDEPLKWVDDPSKPPALVKLYLLETQSFGGNSGSPVFFYLGIDRQPGSISIGPPSIALAGIMRGTFLNSTPVKFAQSPTAVIPYTPENIGVAAVTPSYFLHQVLFSEELTKFREDNPIAFPSLPVWLNRVGH
ncbi:serine protease [Methylocystis sp. Sn-Cys]|uniref:S1 family peptidase n=1 Tax=Methylocystis sp. Sn-Cys TaxID=1701263 RepID=UPI0019247042|nr:serine protease [Methylocystis sp. Sn-Cys]MBL1256675.1 trypsin-like peptidase domain-containing protein [Methylocystis sp. Sn-Cys]